MIEKRLETIINEEIDGVATPEDSARLKQALAGDEEVRRYQKDLQGLSQVMAAMGPVEPPGDLKADILREIESHAPIHAPAPAPRPAPPRESWVAAIFAPFRHFRPAYGATFAGGLAAGLAMMALFGTPGTFENDSLSGVMAPQRTFESYPLGDQASFEFAGGTGTIETRSAHGLVLARITLDVPTDLEIRTTFDSMALHPVGYRSLHPGTGAIFMGANEFRLHHQGENSYWLIFEEGVQPSTIEVTLSSDNVVYKKSLKTGGEGS